MPTFRCHRRGVLCVSLFNAVLCPACASIFCPIELIAPPGCLLNAERPAVVAGQHKSGDGIIRSYEFLREATVTFLTERRRNAPWGLNGGLNARKSLNLFNENAIAGKVEFVVQTGDILEVLAPGGGG